MFQEVRTDGCTAGEFLARLRACGISIQGKLTPSSSYYKGQDRNGGIVTIRIFEDRTPQERLEIIEAIERQYPPMC